MPIIYHLSIIFSYFTGSSQSGIGGSNSVYCGGFLNDFPAATTDAKIRGYFFELLSKCTTVAVTCGNTGCGVFKRGI